jgi:acyl-CoA synthetase (AMP-forming)/AMP-acid ligase II/acyl carrier protein
VKNLLDILERRAATQADRPAYVFLADGEREQGRLDYAELRRRAWALGTRLRAFGTGERALLLFPPGLDFMVAFLGCLHAGLVAVPAYPPRGTRPDPRIAAIARDADAALVLTTARFLDGCEELPGDSPLRRARWLAADLVAAETGSSDPRPADLAFLQYTSGSTAAPKGVMVTHANLDHNLKDLDLGWDHDEASAMVTWLPAFHDMGLIYGLLLPLYKGFPCYQMAPAAFLSRPARWLEALSRHRGTHTAAPNFAYELCVERTAPDARAGLDLRAWRVALNAAEPVRADTLARFEAAFAPAGFGARVFCPGYGLAEATLKVGALPADALYTVIEADSGALAHGRIVPAAPGAPAHRLVGCGRSETDTACLAVDPETRRPCPPGRVGELWVSGPSVAAGYWRQPEASRETFAARTEDGAGPYLRTGDLGFVQGGEVFVTGRLKDTLIIHGLNHYPQDIETSVQASHPALKRDAGAAFAVEADGAERLVVVQEVNRGDARKLDAAAVFGAVRLRVAENHGLACHAIVLVAPATLPKTSSGKLQRRRCRAEFLDGTLNVLAAWHEAAPAAPRAEAVDRAALAGWLSDWLATRLRLDRIDPRRALAEYGLDSAAAVELAAALEARLKRPVEATLIWNFPSVEALAGHLAAPEPPAGHESPAGDPEALAQLGTDRLAELLLRELRKP